MASSSRRGARRVALRSAGAWSRKRTVTDGSVVSRYSLGDLVRGELRRLAPRASMPGVT